MLHYLKKFWLLYMYSNAETKSAVFVSRGVYSVVTDWALKRRVN